MLLGESTSGSKQKIGVGWGEGGDGGVGGNPTDAAALSKRRQKMGS